MIKLSISRRDQLRILFTSRYISNRVFTKPPKTNRNTYLLRLLHPQLAPVVPRLLEERRLLLLAQRPPLLDDLLVPVRPVRVLGLPLRMVHVGVQHGRDSGAVAQTFVRPHLLRRALVVRRGNPHVGAIDVGVLVHVHPRAGRFREGGAELGTTEEKIVR